MHTHGMLSGCGPVLHVLGSRPPSWGRYSYVVLPQALWSKYRPEEWAMATRIPMPETRPALSKLFRPVPKRSFNDMVPEAEEKANMSVHDAEPGDVYVDGLGKLWRCVMICTEPTVTMEEVEGHTVAPFDPAMVGIAAQQYHPPGAPPIIRDRRSGGVGGLMWDGWKRIWRKEGA